MDHAIVAAFPLSISARAALNALPSAFVSGLTVDQQRLVVKAFSVLDIASQGKQTPRLLQLESVLAVASRSNFICRAGTGYGKTLAMILPLLVLERKIAITVSPLKLLQDEHVCSISVYMRAKTDIICARFKSLLRMASRHLPSTKIHQMTISYGRCVTTA